jgi:hypothetical protein
MTQIQEFRTINFLDRDSLYERDFLLWLENTTKLLKEQRFTELDLENLIEEIEDMGKSQRSALESNLVVILLHLLKWKYQPEKHSNSWKASIREHRRRIRSQFKDSPSLKRYFAEIFVECYGDARGLAADETGLELVTFPKDLPFTIEQVLDSDFLPAYA